MQLGIGNWRSLWEPDPSLLVADERPIAINASESWSIRSENLASRKVSLNSLFRDRAALASSNLLVQRAFWNADSDFWKFRFLAKQGCCFFRLNQSK